MKSLISSTETETPEIQTPNIVIDTTYVVDSLGNQAADGSIAVAFGGDGSVAANGFWSGLTMATTLNLPLLFVIEDNAQALGAEFLHADGTKQKAGTIGHLGTTSFFPSKN